MNERELELIKQYAEHDGEVTLKKDEVMKLLTMVDIAKKENLDLISIWYSTYEDSRLNDKDDDALYEKIQECLK